MNTQITLRNADVQIVDADQLRFQVAKRLNVARYLVLKSLDFERNEQSAIDLVVDDTQEAYQIYQVEVKDNVVTFVYLHRSEGERRRGMKHFFCAVIHRPRRLSSRDASVRIRGGRFPDECGTEELQRFPAAGLRLCLASAGNSASTNIICSDESIRTKRTINNKVKYSHDNRLHTIYQTISR